jgi:DNA repair protein SbcD/Mre11
MFKFLHAADIHLDSPLKGLEQYESAPVERMRLATRRALENLVRLAIEERVAFVLLAGDLYDGDWRDYQTGLFLVKQMGRLHEAGIKVFAISGNHDAENRMTRSLQMPTVHRFTTDKASTLRLDDWDVALHGQGFAKAAITDNLVPGYPVAASGCFNIGLLHTGMENGKGHPRYAPCGLDDLRRQGYDYWALGHVHTRETLLDDPLVVFPGNIQGRHIREEGAKGCLLVTIDRGEVRENRFEPLDVVRWERCRVEGAGAVDTDDVLARTVEALAALTQTADNRLLAVRIEIQGVCPAHSTLLAQAPHIVQEIRSLSLQNLGDLAWIEKVVLKTNSPGQGKQLPGDGPLEELRLLFAELRGNEPGLCELASSLEEVKRKLPPEILTDDLTFDNPENLRRLLDRIEPMLHDRLLNAEAAT